MNATAPSYPKVLHSMTAEGYHAHDAASASRLKAIRRSPAHCWHQMKNQNETPARKLGSLLHTVALEPELVTEKYHILPPCDRRTKAGKEEWAAAEESGKVVVAQDDYTTAFLMRCACGDHPAWRKLIEAPGQNELSVFWHDDEERIECKLRADRVVDVPGFGKVCVDLKTCADASPEGFARAVHKFGYHVQASWYLHGLAKAGIPCDAFVMIAVESAPPHCVGVYAIGEESIEQGDRECRRLLKLYAACVRSGVWPGYGDKIVSLNLPAWAFDEDEL